MIVKVTISSPSEEFSHTLSTTLVERRLVAGTRITEGTSHYWWDGGVSEANYWNISAYTLDEKKQTIIDTVKAIHPDDCPIISFTRAEGNDEFEQWVRNSIE